MTSFLHALDAEIADLERQLEANPTFKKLREAKRLRAFYGSEASGSSGLPSANQGERAGPGASRPFSTGISADILAAARAYMEGKLVPVPTRELMRHLEQEGIEVGGSVPQNAVSSLLSKSPDFVSQGRKGWLLASVSPEKGKAPGVDAGEQSPEAFSSRPVPEAHGLKAGPGGGT
jgi:hypothetical protein